MSTLIEAQIPNQPLQQANRLVDQGWASDLQELLNESLRRYVESHQDALNERLLREDVEWGLRGAD